MQILVGGQIDARAEGVTGDGSDQTDAFQALAQNVPLGSTIVLPMGTVKVNRPIDLTWNVNGKPTPFGGVNSPISIVGAGKHSTRIVGNFAGPLLGRNWTSSKDIEAQLRVSDLTLQNPHVQGVGLAAERVVDVVIDRVLTQCGLHGIVIGQNQTLRTVQDVSISRCTFRSDLATTPTSVGLWLSAGTASVRACSAYQCGTGFELGGNISVSGLHIEVCGIGLRTGLFRNYSGTLADVSTEACITHVQLAKNTGSAVIEALSVLGDLRHVSGMPSLWPQFGLEMLPGCKRVTLTGCGIGGSFEQCAAKLAGMGPVVVINSSAGNKGQATSGSTAGWVNSVSDITWIQSA